MAYLLVLRCLVASIGLLFFVVLLHMQSLPIQKRRAFARGIASVADLAWIREEDESVLDKLVRNHIVLYSMFGSLFVLWAISGIGFS